MVRIYKYLVVSALIALLCSCEADYKPDDLFGDWHENTGYQERLIETLIARWYYQVNGA